MGKARKIVLLIDGVERLENAKTAVNVIRYRREEAVALLDRRRAGATSQQLFGIGGDLPVVAHLEDAPPADTLVIGVAPSGGQLPGAMRESVLDALRRGWTVVSGLHQFLSDDAELVRTAETHGAHIQDLRKNHERSVADFKPFRPGCLRVHTVGQDCNVGKMLVAWELNRALNSLGHDAEFIATGQTGILLQGDGCPVDAVVSDFLSGAVERLVRRHDRHDFLLVEGQGTLVHPRYAAVTLGLLHGCRPQALILCYALGRTTISGMPEVPLTPLERLIPIYEQMAAVLAPGHIIGVAINGHGAPADALEAERNAVRQRLGLPACDVIRHGPADLVDAILRFRADHPETPPAAPA